MVADEVICGFGRTGNMFGSETLNIQPDIMTMAKALSSAYLPISAVLINAKMFDAISTNSDKIGTFGHGFTYSGHPVPAAVAVETLKIYEERDIIGHVRNVMSHFLKRLHSYRDHPLVGETRGVGLVGAIELVRDKETHESFDPSLGVGAYISAQAQEHGLIVRAMGDSVAFSPPLIITEPEIDDMFDRFEKGLEAGTTMVSGMDHAAE